MGRRGDFPEEPGWMEGSRRRVLRMENPPDGLGDRGLEEREPAIMSDQTEEEKKLVELQCWRNWVTMFE